MRIPLDKRLKKRLHRDVGYLQDELVEILYSIAPDMVLHGGTAVWRCFGGTRFSEDLDFYVPVLRQDFGERLKAALSARGLQLLKFKQTENLVFAKVSGREAEVRVEINFSRKVSSAPLAFEKMGGSAFIVFSLSLEDLVLEKAAAYSSRRFARDIFDVYFLCLQLEDDAQVKARLSGFSRSLPEPVDEGNLAATIYSGAVPTFKQMREYLAGRFS
ncbi:MAG: nucleotidyl transferase AbiEii/AbiGii toxin family protein [Candidatus Micrarchaeota archaeon]